MLIPDTNINSDADTNQDIDQDVDVTIFNTLQPSLKILLLLFLIEDLAVWAITPMILATLLNKPKIMQFFPPYLTCNPFSQASECELKWFCNQNLQGAMKDIKIFAQDLRC